MLKILIIPVLMSLQQTPVTFTSIDYINGTDSLKVTVRINNELFLRDYQQTIFDDLDLGFLRSLKPFPADLANNYLNSKIKILVNGTEIIGKLQKLEEAGADIKFSILYRVSRRMKEFTVKNTMLTGLSSKVENLVTVKDRYSESARKLTSGNVEETFTLKRKLSGKAIK
jgi:hypothetical protein